MIIGLAGQIGSGKSSVAKILARFGAIVISADQIGHEVVDRSQALRLKLVRAFGPTIIDSRGIIRRKKLAELAFAGEDSRIKLNSLVHPYLLAELRKQLRQAKRGGKIVVIDAALLLYWKMDREVDCVIVVHASRQLRLNRLQARGVDRKDALARERAQLPYSEYLGRADHVILNNGTKADLSRKVRTLLSRLDS